MTMLTQNTPETAAQETNAPCNEQLVQQLGAAEALTNDLKRLLVKHEGALNTEGITHNVEVLERWMESYRRGLAAANKISENGMAWLIELRDRLKLSAEELERLESEGGNPLTKEQVEKMEELMRTVRSIDKVIPNIEQVIIKPAGATADKEHEHEAA